MKEQLLRKQNKQKLLKWSREYQHWTIEEWNNVIWTDESKLELFGIRRRMFVRRSVSEAWRRSSDGVGLVVSFSTVGDIAQIDAIWKDSYRAVLQHHAILPEFDCWVKMLPSSKIMIQNASLNYVKTTPFRSGQNSQNYGTTFPEPRLECNRVTMGRTGYRSTVISSDIT